MLQGYSVRKIATASKFRSRTSKKQINLTFSAFPTNCATNPEKSPMPSFRSPTHLPKSSALPYSRPARSLQQSRLLPARTFSTHPPDVSEHPSPETATHESHYDPPSGWFLGVPPGQKYQKEGWENTWVYGFWGSLLFGVVAYAYKPDTS